jgi:Arc/MetJ family transcription regulator
MKRTNVVLDEHLLDEAVRVSGEPTYSKTIERALTEMIQRARARSIDRLAGSGLWGGSLAEMRADSAPLVARETSSVYRTRKRRVAR